MSVGTGVDAARRSSRLLRLGLRTRLMIVGVTGLAIALGCGSVALYLVLTVSVNKVLDNEARASADDVVALVDRGTLPDPLPVSGAQVVQIVDRAHRVVDGSVNADRLTPLLDPDQVRRALTGEVIDVGGDRTGLSGPLRVVARSAGVADAQVAVLVAQQVGDLRNSTDILRTALLIVVPLLLAVLALIAWYAIGLTLRPVEALRRGAERISGSGQAERLPVPRSTDEIAALAVTLNAMLDRLAAARGRQRAFVADAAHELRSPLASISVQLEVAQRTSGGSVAQDVLIDVQRLSALVEDLLLLARMDADTRGPAKPIVFDARTLLEEVAAARQFGRVPIEVVPGPAASVEADRSEIARAVGNLVDNAVRHARTRVALLAAGTAGQVILSVVDDGLGIAAADRARAFSRFTRLDDARDRDAGGSGLGLAIVAELVARAAGSVVLVDPAAGTGLEARIVLPAPRS